MIVKHTHIYSTSSFRTELAAGKVYQAGVEGLSLEGRPLGVPSLLKSLKLLLLLSGWQPHLLSLLFIHNFANSSLGFIIKILERFGVINLRGVYFWIPFEDSSPDPLFCLF